MLKAHIPEQVLVRLNVANMMPGWDPAWLEELLVKTEETLRTPSNPLVKAFGPFASPSKLDASRLSMLMQGVASALVASKKKEEEPAKETAGEGKTTTKNEAVVAAAAASAAAAVTPSRWDNEGEEGSNRPKRENEDDSDSNSEEERRWEDEEEDEEEEEGEEDKMLDILILLAFAESPLGIRLKNITFSASCREMVLRGWLSQEEAGEIVEGLGPDSCLDLGEHLVSQVQELWKAKAKKERKGLGKTKKQQQQRGGGEKEFTSEIYSEMREAGCEHVWKEVARRVEDRVEHLILTEGLRPLVGEEWGCVKTMTVLKECVDRAGRIVKICAADIEDVGGMPTMLERVRLLIEYLDEKFGKENIQECVNAAIDEAQDGVVEEAFGRIPTIKEKDAVASRSPRVERFLHLAKLSCFREMVRDGYLIQAQAKALVAAMDDEWQPGGEGA